MATRCEQHGVNRYRFHFDDYTVPDLCKIVNIKIKAKGYKLTPDADKHLPQACRAPCPGRASAPINRMVRHRQIIEKGTNADLRSKYNGRLTDNLLQWCAAASAETARPCVA